MESHYNESYYEAVGQSTDRPALWFYYRLAKFYFQPGAVLDFGCGTGFFIKRLSQHFAVAGYDISGYALASAQLLVPDAIYYRSIDEIPSNTFSGITSLHVLEHLTDNELDNVIKAWKRALHSDGRILCVVPDVNGKGHKIKGNNWFAYRDESHINLKAREEWKQMFSDAGFRINKVGTDGLWDFPYMPGAPKMIDAAINSFGTIFQYLLGGLLLSEGEGESSVFVLESNVKCDSSDRL